MGGEIKVATVLENRGKVPSRLEPGVSSLPVRRFTLDKYYELIDIGFFRSDDRVELLNGWLIPKMAINPPHASTIRRIMRLFYKLLDESWVIDNQNPITLPASESELQPDVFIAKGPPDAYQRRHPFPKDIVLLIEVAETSPAVDRDEKLQAYAAAKIGVYWIINLVDDLIEVYSEPRSGKSASYTKRINYLRGETVPLKLSSRQSLAIRVDDILP